MPGRETYRVRFCSKGFPRSEVSELTKGCARSRHRERDSLVVILASRGVRCAQMAELTWRDWEESGIAGGEFDLKRYRLMLGHDEANAVRRHQGKRLTGPVFPGLTPRGLRAVLDRLRRRRRRRAARRSPVCEVPPC